MNNHYIEPKTRPTILKPKFLGIPRPLAGAVIGFFIFLIPSLFIFISRIYFTALFSAVLLGPGLLTYWIISLALGLSADTHQIFLVLVAFGVSSIPPTIIGLLIGSYNNNWRVTGILLLLLYGLILAAGSPIWIRLWFIH
jgi:hypothetical protein